MMHIAYLALGSNLGDRAAMLASARERLDRLPGTRVVTVSSVYETAPVGGPPGQGDYLNAALKIETTFTPHELLAACLTVEQALGRVRDVPNAPRSLDIDILLYDDLVLDSPELIIPHPRMHERWFVLAPLCEIAASVVHPTVRAPMGELLVACKQKPGNVGGA